MPEQAEVIDAVSRLERDYNSQARNTVVKGLDGDKQKAVDSLGAGKDTGEDPQVIYSDFDRYMKRRKGEVAQSLIEDDSTLKEYVRTNPLSSTVSQDDWGALSEYTQKIRDFNKYVDEKIPRWAQYTTGAGLPLAAARALPETIDYIKGGIKGISDAFTAPSLREEPQEEKLPSYLTPETQKQLDEYVKKYAGPNVPFDVAFSALQVLGAPMLALLKTEVWQPISEATGIREDIVEGYGNLALMVVPGLKGVTPKGVRKSMTGWTEAQAAREKAVADKQVRQTLDRINRTVDRAETWAKSGERPPIGVDPALDQLIGLESINRMTALDAVMERANKTEGKELSPEAFADLNRIAFRNSGSIYLRWDAAKSLYGEVMPEAGDKKLGDIPRAYEQFKQSQLTGEPIEIPLSELPGLDKELYKLLHDDLHFEGTMTVKQAKELVKAEPEISTIHEEQMPGLSEDLRRPFTLKDVGEGLHDVVDENGMKAGQLRVVEQEGGKNLFIGWEKGQYDTAGLITLMNQLKAKYPNAETISTVRIPGTKSLERALQGSDIGVDMPFRIKDRPVDLVRRAAGLEPLFDLSDEGPRTLRMVRGEAPGMYLKYGPEAWTLTNELGQPVGSLEISLRDVGKEVHIAWIGSAAEHPGASLMPPERLVNKLGPSLIRSLVQQIKENYPNAERITGTRISGAREKKEAARERAESEAGKVPRIWSGDKVEISIKDLLDEAENMPAGWHPTTLMPETEKLFQLINEGFSDWGGGRWVQRGRPFAPEELKLERSIDKFLDRLVGKDVDILGVREIRSLTARGEGGVAGFFRFYEDRRPFIMWALEGPDPYATAGHEAIHFLRHFQYIRPNEWEILSKAAKEQGWLDRPEMGRYEHLKERFPELYLEEAIADEFKRWARLDREQQQLHGMAKVFQKIQDMIDAVKSAYREWSGAEPTADLIMRDIQLGRISRREPLGASQERLKMFGMADLADIKEEKPPPIEEKVPTFAPGAIMDKKMYAQYQRHLNEQNANDIRIEREHAVRDANRRNAPEWKANKEEMKKDVAQELGARPEFRARAFFQNGTFFGQETHYMPKVDPKLLTPEQRAQFPARWQERKGVDPDMLAQSFGYQTGAAMIDAMIKFERDKGSLTPKEFFERTVNKEADRRMELRYGNLAEKNLQEAMEHVVGHTQMKLLMQEAMALATRAGMKLSLTKENVKAMAANAFIDSKQVKANYKYFMQELYRTGKAAEHGFLVGDYIEAFQNKWMQVHIHEMAREVKQLDKERGQLERAAHRFYKRYPDNFPPEFTEWIQYILDRTGHKLDRHPDDLQRMLQVRDHKGDFNKFVEEINDLVDPDIETALNPYLVIPDFILDDQGFRKDIKDMNVGELRAVNGAIQSLQRIGAEQGKLHRLGEAADLQKELTRAKAQLESIGPEKPPKPPGKRAKLHQMYHIGSLRPEDLLFRLDKGNEEGFFTQFLTDPLNTAAYKFDQLWKSFRQKRIDIDKKWGATTRKAVENDIFYHPKYMEKDPATGKMVPRSGKLGLMSLTHEHVRGVLLNWGNKSNRERLVEGFHTTEAAIQGWLDKVASKEDYKWARDVGHLYFELQKETDEVTMRESNTMVELIPLPEIDTPHGKLDGWYYPIHYDRALDGGSKNTLKLSPPKYARTYRGFERKRTGSAGPLDMSLNSLDMDINRRIHDISYREVLRDFRKIKDDTALRGELEKRMGRHYVEMLDNLHDDIARPYKSDSGALAAANQYSEAIRGNTIMLLVGLKAGTFIKHVGSTFVQSWGRLGLTKIDFWQSAVDLMMSDEKTQTNNWTFVTKGGPVGSLEFTGSREIARRWKHYAQAHGVESLELRAKTIRETAMDWSSRPIAAGDMLSSVILWNSLYKKLRKQYMEEGMTIEEAHTKADTRADFAVRQTHGSTSVVSRPEFMRQTGSMARWFTSLYSYYNHVYGQLYRMAWRSKDMVQERRRGDPTTQSLPEYASDMASSFMTYVALPAAFYWLAQDFLLGKEDDEEHNLAYKIAMPIIHNVGGAGLGVRDVLGFIAGGGQQPVPGIIGQPMQQAWNFAKHFDPDKEWKELDPGKVIRYGNNVWGIATGTTNDQVGIWAQFIYNYMQAVQEPEGAADVYRGLRRGTIERRKK